MLSLLTRNHIIHSLIHQLLVKLLFYYRSQAAAGAQEAGFDVGLRQAGGPADLLHRQATEVILAEHRSIIGG